MYGVNAAPKPVEFIPVNTPIFLGDERKFLLDCVDTGWISSEGSYVKRFEQDMASYVGRKHAVAVANGTAAIDIAVGNGHLTALLQDGSVTTWGRNHAGQTVVPGEVSTVAPPVPVVEIYVIRVAVAATPMYT